MLISGRTYYFCATMIEQTTIQFQEQVARCRALFLQKNRDYGSSWRILRPASLTDQLYIKALRIRNIQEKGVQRIQDPVEGEFIGLVNYSVLALIQLEQPADTPLNLSETEVAALYDRQIAITLDLLQAKNHDYGEAWRQMRVSSITDLILQKLLRVKQIEDHAGQTLVSEGLDANYRDILNYAVFALILLKQS
jgi:Nucleotide modification associated domain 1